MSKPVCYSTKAFAAASAAARLAATTIERRSPGSTDVQIEILYCGVCHSDLHFARDEWHFTQYPAVPGHEIVGRVTAVGSGVKKFKVGETVGVGCLVDSCRTCPDCRAGLEQFCAGMVMTYGSMDKHLNAPTLGGYAQSIVVTEEFVLRLPANLSPAAAAPLLGRPWGKLCDLDAWLPTAPDAAETIIDFLKWSIAQGMVSVAYVIGNPDARLQARRIIEASRVDVRCDFFASEAEGLSWLRRNGLG